MNLPRDLIKVIEETARINRAEKSQREDCEQAWKAVSSMVRKAFGECEYHCDENGLSANVVASNSGVSIDIEGIDINYRLSMTFDERRGTVLTRYSAGTTLIKDAEETAVHDMTVDKINSQIQAFFEAIRS